MRQRRAERRELVERVDRAARQVEILHARARERSRALHRLREQLGPAAEICDAATHAGRAWDALTRAGEAAAPAQLAGDRAMAQDGVAGGETARAWAHS